MKPGKKNAGDINVRIGARVRHARIRKGLSLQRLGEGTGVSYQQMQKYEDGRNALSPAKLTELAAVLGVQVTFFFDAADGDDEFTADRNLRLERLMRRLQEIECRKPKLFQEMCLLVAALTKEQ